MQKHVHKHQTHSRSWRTHWHWECLSDFINGSTLRRDKWILSQTVWCFSESTPSINEELVKPMVITGVVINKSPKMKSFLHNFYLRSDKHLPPRQTWKPWFTLTTIFTLQETNSIIQLQPQLHHWVVFSFINVNTLTSAPASPLSPWNEEWS